MEACNIFSLLAKSNICIIKHVLAKIFECKTSQCPMKFLQFYLYRYAGRVFINSTGDLKVQKLHFILSLRHTTILFVIAIVSTKGKQSLYSLTNIYSRLSFSTLYILTCHKLNVFHETNASHSIINHSVS